MNKEKLLQMTTKEIEIFLNNNIVVHFLENLDIL